MLRAGSLIIVLVISLVIGLMSASLILLAFYNRLQTKELLREKRLERNADSGINLMLWGVEIVKPGEEKLLDLFGEGVDSVSLKKSRWGLFEIGIVRSFYGTFSGVKAFLAGKGAGEKEKIALYLTDQNRPLSVAGKTEIIGDAYLPAASIRKAYVDGKAFEGEETVHGTILTSNAELPALNGNIIRYLETNFSIPVDTVLPGTEIIFGLSSDSINRSFLQDRLIIRATSPVILDNTVLKGNIVVISDQNVTLGAGTRLEDVILFAPSVLIKEGFEGSLQVLARDSIRVEKNCRLNYPSVLGIIKKQDSLSVEETQPELILEEGSSLTGIVFTRALEGDDVQETRVTIQKGATVNGQVYVDGFLDLQGKVTGSVFCNRFILQTASTLYENHLLDAVIDYRSLPVYFTGSKLINTGKKGRVIKWIR